MGIRPLRRDDRREVLKIRPKACRTDWPVLSQEFRDKARALRKKLLGNVAFEDDESEDAYNILNLWMLW